MYYFFPLKLFKEFKWKLHSKQFMYVCILKLSYGSHAGIVRLFYFILLFIFLFFFLDGVISQV